MQQYFKIKAKHGDALLLFRVGDFYETFSDDAEKTAAVLGIVLTSRNNGGSNIPLAGFPYHSLDLYLPRLVKAGFRVAICEQLEKPSKEKKIVKRGVTEIVTPGIATDEKLLDHKQNNFLAALHIAKGNVFGLALLDLSTGEFFCCEDRQEQIEKLMVGFQPSEILFSKEHKAFIQDGIWANFYSYPLDEWIFMEDYAQELLTDQFEVNTLKGFGIEALSAAKIASGTILHYLKQTENDKLNHITAVQKLYNDRFLAVDPFTIRNLELLHPSHTSGVALINILDKTVSPMGGRLMRRWVLFPLLDLDQIKKRQLTVDAFIKEENLSIELDSSLKAVGDLERLISKVALRKVNPKELVHLKKALLLIKTLQSTLSDCNNEILKEYAKQFVPCPDVVQILTNALNEDVPASISKGNVIRSEFHPEIKELRHIIKNSNDILLQIQQTEAKKTSITNLKIGFNNVFGYYLEVTNKYKNQGLVPDNWVRKQTLTGSERYITEELKVVEDKILNAQSRVNELELQLFQKLIEDIQPFIQSIQKNAMILGQLDCLSSFAKSATEYNYCLPEVNNSLVIDIKAGRHPVIEKQLPLGEAYVPNDTLLDNEGTQIMMITGPNMSGKSAVLRQTALICLMAQMGCYVPATTAKLGLIDKLFTRVGASDNISSGESTFMVEMNETASIMNNLSVRSLILLDEIGRGTSTYDGISIAWSLAEYLHNNEKAAPKTLFATHYHELNDLANKYDRIQNYNVSVKELGNKVIFLRKLAQGGSHHSFGIHVARMAGMPKEIISRAQEVLNLLEQKSIAHGDDAKVNIPKTEPSSSVQLSIFDKHDPFAGQVKSELQNLQINTMTPIECMMKLNELIALLGE